MTSEDQSIEVRKLSKRYGSIKAVDDISFSVHPGEVIGFLGPNGAGKSTTMRILCGLQSATSGAAWICGYPVATRTGEVRRRVGFMPENNPLPEDLRVIEYLRFRAQLKEVPWRQRRRRIAEVAEQCDLDRKTLRKVIGNLSKGYRQRVGIADALLGGPEVVIMDEPTIGLDPHQVQSIRELIEHLRGQVTVVISSHILPEVEISCDRVIVINRGHIVASGTPENLRSQFIPRTLYRLSLNGSRKALDQIMADVDPSLHLVREGETNFMGFRTVELETPLPTDLGAILLGKIAHHPDLKLREFARVEPTLEEVFLKATEEGWRKRSRAPFISNGPNRPRLPKPNPPRRRSRPPLPASTTGSEADSEVAAGRPGSLPPASSGTDD